MIKLNTYIWNILQPAILWILLSITYFEIEIPATRIANVPFYWKCHSMARDESWIAYHKFWKESVHFSYINGYMLLIAAARKMSPLVSRVWSLEIYFPSFIFFQL